MKTTKCYNCICLPVCINKNGITLINDCAILKHEIAELIDDADVDVKTEIYVGGVNRDITITKREKFSLPALKNERWDI